MIAAGPMAAIFSTTLGSVVERRLLREFRKTEPQHQKPMKKSNQNRLSPILRRPAKTGPGRSARSPVVCVSLLMLMAVLCTNNAKAQNTLTNGGNHDGTILLGGLDSWTFTANSGDNIVLRSAQLSTANRFNPWMQLYGPDGVLIADSGGNNSDTVREIALTTTSSGTFTVLVSDSSYYGIGGTGKYRLYFAKFPGAFVIADDGGPLTNGGNHDGTILLGDLDFWTFTANSGDKIVLRSAQLSTTDRFNPWMRLYGPDGVLIEDSGSDNSDPVREIALTTTSGGTFTVLVSDSSYYGFGGTGKYRLYFAKFPGAFVIADDGGPLTNGGNRESTILLGDLDLWYFTACRGDHIVLRSAQLSTTDRFNPWMRLYGPDGVLIADSGNDNSDTVREIALTTTNSGAFTVLVSDSSYYGFGGTGNYRLNVNGLSAGLNLCIPIISGTSLTLDGIGGVPNAIFVLYTSTNVATPAALWTPILTNHFDQFGVFNYGSLYDPAVANQFFLLQQQ
jgi:hypothetical protein